MRAAPNEQPKTTEAIANELTGYDALLLMGPGFGSAAETSRIWAPEGVFHNADIRHQDLAKRRSLRPGQTLQGGCAPPPRPAPEMLRVRFPAVRHTWVRNFSRAASIVRWLLHRAPSPQFSCRLTRNNCVALMSAYACVRSCPASRQGRTPPAGSEAEEISTLAVSGRWRSVQVLLS